MKKLLVLFIAFTLVSCDDGEFNVPAFDFEDEVYGCGENSALYITSSADTEAMVMTLIDDELGTEVGTESYSITSTRQVVYRIFSEGIGSDYFCQSIPPTVPAVITELIAAEGGTINITTSEVYTDEELTGYNYEIILTDLLFVDEDGLEISYETFAFGNDYEIDIED